MEYNFKEPLPEDVVKEPVPVYGAVPPEADTLTVVVLPKQLTAFWVTVTDCAPLPSLVEPV